MILSPRKYRVQNTLTVAPESNGSLVLARVPFVKGAVSKYFFRFDGDDKNISIELWNNNILIEKCFFDDTEISTYEEVKEGDMISIKGYNYSKDTPLSIFFRLLIEEI